MKWIDKLAEWESGIPQKYPENVTNTFFYETSKCSKDLSDTYQEKYIQSNKLHFPQDYTAFNNHITKVGNKSVTKAVNKNSVTKKISKIRKERNHSIGFFNLSKDTFLVIPVPKKGKDFSTIKQFMDNASYSQQRGFWKDVASAIKRMLKKYDHVYVSTHGLGVPYFHLRINTYPKFYQTKKFIE